MEFHPVANIFPMMTEAELADLAADIRANGLIDSIWTHKGRIIDGRNRYRACLAAGETPRFQEWNGDEKDLVGFVLSLNLKRRHLDASQRAVIGLAIEKYEAERAKERQSHGQTAPGKTLLEKIPEALEAQGNARDFAAAAVGVNARYIQDAKRIEAQAPDLIPEIAAGNMNIPQAKREMIKRERESAPPPAMPTAKYRVLYADPPWYYAQQIEKYGPAERHYRTMQTEDICAMGDKVAAVTESDAVLFLWSTAPKLEDALSVIKAWGFRYTGAMFVWDKIRHNYGHYNSVRHELLLICVKGSCTPDIPKLFDSVQAIERSDKHSEKPQEFREIIDTLYTHGKRLELFARTPIAGWDVWGDEV